MTQPFVVIGDAMLDIDLVGRVHRLAQEAPVPVLTEAAERPRAGGAGLCATLAVGRSVERDRPVVLVTTLAEDSAAQRLRAALGPAVTVIALPGTGHTPVKTRLRTDGHALARVDTGGVRPPDRLTPGVAAEIKEAVAAAAVVVVADYGNGTAAQADVRAALGAAVTRVPVVWDPHLLGPAPVPGTTIVTPNLFEAQAAAGGSGERSPALRDVAQLAERLRECWSARSVAITMGASGALLDQGTGLPLVVPAPDVAGGDACGAGDCFAVTVAAALAAGALPSEAVVRAVTAAADFVASGGAGGVAGANRSADRPVHLPSATADAPDALAVAAEVRSRGGTLAATGGCFDLMHAGHIATLQAARRMGDALVVCLNSDASVRRLKGPGRPLQPAADRARILRALSCVDAVIPFGEDTPTQVLEQLRPDVWVKGGDYTARTLPEAAELASWGGQVVAVPYLPERSTTRLVSAAGGRALAQSDALTEPSAQNRPPTEEQPWSGVRAS